jgi:chromate reductase, NAD(P)H dehydrogenase (quinone)
MAQATRLIRILAISGSLRAASSNRTLLQAVASLAPATVDVSIYAGLADLPPFNPDEDIEPAPPAVADFRRRLHAADAVVFSTPEYAHGIPGTLKNALDWVVSSGELVDKPVALVNASPRATYAQASLIETLTVMSARLVDGASVTIPLAGTRLDAAAIGADPAHSSALRSALETLTSAVDRTRRIDRGHG